MSASRTTLRLITVLFLLAGVLLLRKPVFGQAITAAPTRFSVVIPGVTNPGGPSFRSLTAIGWGIRAGRREPHYYYLAAAISSTILNEKQAKSTHLLVN
jgi:hypothetical protein